VIFERLGVITDEVSSDLTEALEFAVREGLKHVEIRTVGGVNVVNLDDDDIAWIKQQIDRYGLYVSALSSPIFKCALDCKREVASGDSFGMPEEDVEAHFIKLHRMIDIAKALGTTKIRVFSFWRERDPDRYTDDIVKHLRRAADIAEGHHVLLLLENEPACNAGYAAEVAKILQKVDSPALKALWDPGNEEYGGRLSFPDGYRQVKDAVRHVHLKDALIDDTGHAQCVPIGMGRVPFVEQIRELEEDGYQGLYTIETHYIPSGGTALQGTCMSLRGLRKLLMERE
jgi:L-ribulose-5-phosphate 3-epimerase